MCPGDLFSRGGMCLVVSVTALCPEQQLLVLLPAVRLAPCCPPSLVCGGSCGEAGPVVQRAADGIPALAVRCRALLGACLQTPLPRADESSNRSASWSFPGGLCFAFPPLTSFGLSFFFFCLPVMLGTSSPKGTDHATAEVAWWATAKAESGSVLPGHPLGCGLSLPQLGKRSRLKDQQD